MNSFSTIWHDPVWSKVIASILFLILTEILARIKNRGRPFWRLFTEVWKYKLPVWAMLGGLAIVYAGTHFTTFDYFVYLCVLFLIVVYGILARPALAEISQKSAEPTKAPDVKGPPVHKIWFDSNEANMQCLSVTTEKRWENNAAVGATAEGSLAYLNDKMIEIRRTNADGRIVVKFDRMKPYGANDRIIARDTSRPPMRKFAVVFVAKTINGSHLLWFMAKHAGQPQWIHNASDKAEVSHDFWKQFSLSISVPSTEDFELFFEDRDVKRSPSSIQIKDLQVIEY